MPLRPEIDIVMACTLPPGARDAHDRVQTALAGRVDWLGLTALANHHGVLPLLYTCLADFAPGMVPERVLEQFAMESRRNTARNLYLARVLVRLLSAFADAGIAVLPFKGPILAQQAYGNPALRVFADLDLLVRPPEVAAALKLLASQGYRVNERLEWVTPETWTRWSPEVLLHNCDTFVDLQWRLLLQHYPVQFDLERVWHSRIPVDLVGSEVHSFAPDVLLQLLALHGSKHCWERLCWIADIAWLFRAEPALDWLAVIAAAKDPGCRRSLLLTAALLIDVQHAKLPPELEKLIKRDPAVQTLRAKVWMRLTEGWLEPPTSRELFDFAAGLSPSCAKTIRHFLGLLFSPTEAEWEALRLPASLFILYVPFRVGRLVLKYLWRMWWRDRIARPS